MGRWRIAKPRWGRRTRVSAIAIEAAKLIYLRINGVTFLELSQEVSEGLLL
jgi:hypothetical protein